MGELNIEGKALTFFLRVRNDGVDWNRTLFSKHGGPDRLQYNLFCFSLPDGSLDIGAEIGTEFGLAKAAAVIPADELRGWHDIAVRYDGRSIDLFWNGERRGTTRHRGKLRRASDVPLIIAGEPTSNGDVIRRFTGLIDHAAIWDRALHDDEIAVLSGTAGGAYDLYDEPLRPQVHFTPPTRWINDPNGLVYHDGEYHLFYQFNPYGDQWGHMSWGHAVSTDLMHWEHLDTALLEEDGVMIFSGCAVYDEANRSGLGTRENPPLVAVYTGHDTNHDPPRQYQCLAFSLDRGRTWTKHAGNPVLDIDAEHFRDPKVFWHEETERWIMVVARAVDRIISIYGSTNLKNWELLSEFGPAGAIGVLNWECPDLFELPVDGDPNNTRWVLQVDVGDGAANGGSGGQYFIGDFDGTTFTNENHPSTTLWIDHGTDFYAMQSFDGVPDGRRIGIAWMSNWRYASAIPTYPWRGAMTLPREISLTQTPDGVRIQQVPVQELASIRMRTTEIRGSAALPPGPLEIELVVDIREKRQGSLEFNCNGELVYLVGWDVESGTLQFDRRDAAAGLGDAFASVMTAPLPPELGQDLSLRIVVDSMSVEVFAEDGQVAITALVLPEVPPTDVNLKGDLLRAKVNSLGPVWNSP